jgi:putative ABC transport system permease protein
VLDTGIGKRGRKMLLDKFNYAFRSLMHSHIRTLLTILGVVVGVAAIIILLSVSLGLDKTIETELNKFGANNAVVLPISQNSVGSSIGPAGTRVTSKLYESDIQKIKAVSGVKSATGVLSVPAKVKYRQEEYRISVYGIDPYVLTTYYPNVEILEGRMLQSSDSKSIVLGYDIAKNVFDKNIDLGSVLTLNDQSYTVIGILKESGGQAGSDKNLFISFNDARILSTLNKDEVSVIYFVIQDGFEIRKVQENVEFVLRNAHRVKEGEEDFTIQTAETAKESIQSILGYITLFLGTVAAISIVVGGIGIMNSMYMAITERTYEIGVLKSLGVKKNDILHLFLIESGLIGLGGGIIAVIFSVFVVSIANIFLEGSISLLLTWELILGGLCLSFILGLISGYIPSKQAADLDVLDALGRK